MITDPKKVVDLIVHELHEYCMKYGIRELITGISGGVDSAVVFALCAKVNELNGDIQQHGIFLDCGSSQKFKDLACKVMVKFGHPSRFGHIAASILLDSNQLFKQLCEYTVSSDEDKVAHGNIKARLRMIALYHIANTRSGKGMVMSTDNLSEYLMGFWTLHGDVGDYGSIQNLWKTEVYQLAKELGVPEEVIAVKPDDDLGITDGGDEEQLGASYYDIDYFMMYLLEHGFDPNGTIDQLKNIPFVKNTMLPKLAERCIKTAYKRNNPIGIRRDRLELLNYDHITS